MTYSFNVVAAKSMKRVNVSSIKGLAKKIVYFGIEENEDVVVFDANHNFVLRTIGPFLDKCPDAKFRQKLLKVLVPLQLDAEKKIMEA